MPRPTWAYEIKDSGVPLGYRCADDRAAVELPYRRYSGGMDATARFYGGARWRGGVPIAARSQQQLPVVAFLSARWPAEAASDLAAFRQGLGQTGFFEGKNVAIEYRWAEGRYDRLPAMAAELVARQVTVIAAVGGEPSGLAAKAATATIPIVCTLGGDAVADGLVTNLSRPGGNITGATIMGLDMGPKRIELAHQLVPNGSALATLINSKFSLTLAEARDMQAAAHSLRVQLTVLDASTESEIDAVFAGFARQKVDALLINTDPFLFGRRDQIVQLAARYRVPTLYFLREFVDAGGLISYGPNIHNGYRQAGIYVGRILKGEKVGELPVVQPTRFDLVLNLRTARALGLEIPTMLLIRADEVIE